MEQSLHNKISAYLNQSRFAEAINLLQSSEEEYKSDARYWELLALSQGMYGSNKECENSCLKAIMLNPSNIGTYINLGLAQQNLSLFDEAEKTLLKAYKMDATHPQVNNNLGALYILQSEYAKARPYIKKAISIDKNYSDAYSNLAEIQKHFQDEEKAISSYKQAIKLNSYNINAYIGLGSLLSFQGSYDEAGYYLTTAMRINPHHPELIFNLGFLSYLKKDYDSAIQYFNDTIELDPNHQYAQYLLSAITGNEVPDQSPENYVKGLFDNYAETFDKHLVSDLGYNVPVTMYDIFKQYANPVKTDMLLDLGCGTGISGEKFKGSYKYLMGVDLSEKMLIKAEKKAVYDELSNSEISNYLNTINTYYDLVIAADVFVYIGNIEELVKTIYAKQSGKGYFLFSIEKSFEHKSFHLRNTGRYSHNIHYINEIINNALYNIITCQSTILRNEKGTDIEGVIYLCQK